MEDLDTHHHCPICGAGPVAEAPDDSYHVTVFMQAEVSPGVTAAFGLKRTLCEECRMAAEDIREAARRRRGLVVSGAADLPL